MALIKRGRPEREDAERLHTYLDDRAMGVLAPRSPIDPELAATVSRVHDEGSGSAAPPQLKAAIWEELMQNAAYADPGSLAAPLPQTEHSRTGTSPQHGQAVSAGTPRRWSDSPSRVRPLHWLLAAVVLLSIGGGGLITRFNESTPPPGGNQAAMMAPNPEGSPQATPPLPEGATFPPAADCTVPVLRINEIAAAVMHADNGTEMGPNQRDLPQTVPNMTTSEPPLPEGEPVDDATATAITDVYRTYIACVNAGSVRQQYWLFTFDGIARALIPNGNPVYGNIATLGVEPTPVAGNVVAMMPFEDLRLLPDGRVAGTLATRWQDSDQLPNYVIFAQINGQWLIDDLYCGTCG